MTTRTGTLRSPTTAHQTAVLISAVITQLMIVLDMTVVAIALPSMQNDLGMTAAQRPWVVTAYSLAFGGLVLFGGRLTAVLGIRRAYRIGLVGFAAASLVAGMAPSFGVLAAARAVQGGFGSLLAPSVLALVSTTFTDPAERAKAFGALGATGGVGAAVGLLLGGALTDSLSWRWSLYVNVVIAAGALLIGLRSLPLVGRRDRATQITDDLIGLALGCAGIFSLVYGLDQAQQHEWTSRSTIVWLTVGGVLVLLFLMRERLATAPVLPLWVVAHPARATSYAVQFLASAAQMGAFLYLTYYFQDYLEYSPLKTGIVFLPMIGALVLTAALAARLLVPRLGAKGMFPIGLAVQAVALGVLAHVTVDSTYTQVALPGLIVYGVGVGLAMPMIFNAGTRGVPENRAGLASAVLNAAQQVGSSFGVALLAVYATHTIHHYVSDRAGQLKTDIATALTQAQTTPDSQAGQSIAHQFTDQLADHAHLHAYSGGFTLLAGILATAAALLLAAAITMLLIQRAHRLGTRVDLPQRPKW